MATDIEKLWVIRRASYIGRTTGLFVFRSRKDAREFRKAKTKRGKAPFYTAPMRATWGPAL